MFDIFLVLFKIESDNAWKNCRRSLDSELCYFEILVFMSLTWLHSLLKTIVFLSSMVILVNVSL